MFFQKYNFWEQNDCGWDLQTSEKSPFLLVLFLFGKKKVTLVLETFSLAVQMIKLSNQLKILSGLL